MNTNNQPLATAKGTSTLARAKFGPGMLLQHDDLEQLNVYTRELNRLMFRSLFGCGVVCGLVVGADPKCGKIIVTVGSGLALDCEGDPIYVPKPQSIVLDEECKPDIPTPLWVVLCRTEKCCAPRTSVCASDEDETTSVCTREREGFEIRIVRTRPKCSCSCPDPDSRYPTQTLSEDACKCVNPKDPCYSDHYDGKCGCDCEDCSNCDCDCVLLARLDREGDHDPPEATPDHRVRRFVRPALIQDPQVEKELKRKQLVVKTEEIEGILRTEEQIEAKMQIERVGTEKGGIEKDEKEKHQKGKGQDQGEAKAERATDASTKKSTAKR